MKRIVTVTPKQIRSRQQREMAEFVEFILNAELGKCCQMEHIRGLACKGVLNQLLNANLPMQHTCKCACHFTPSPDAA